MASPTGMSSRAGEVSSPNPVQVLFDTTHGSCTRYLMLPGSVPQRRVKQELRSVPGRYSVLSTLRRPSITPFFARPRAVRWFAVLPALICCAGPARRRWLTPLRTELRR